eukprot:gene4665-5274_t
MSEPFLVAIEVCPLCSSTRRKFSCTNCVQKGNFIYSNNQEDKELFIDKKSRQLLLEQGKKPLSTRIEKYHALEINKDKKRRDIFVLKQKLEFLRENIASEQHRKEFEIQELKTRRNSFKINWKKLEERKANRSTFEETIQVNIEILSRQKSQLEDVKLGIIAKRKRRIGSLLTNIFPIFSRTIYSEFGTPPRTTISTRGLSSDLILEASLTAETDLEEATKYTYEGGQWIQANLSLTEYCIVEPGLPSSGDYVKYYDWLKSHRKEVRDPDSDTDIHSHPSLGIPAALMYTAQAVHVSSLILDVNLPARMNFKDFGDPYICNKRLMDSVSKLNKNIMYLCSSQLVPQQSISPMQTIKNLEICLSKENLNLGHAEAFDVYDYSLPDIFSDSDSSIDDLRMSSDDEDNDDDVMSAEDWDSLTDLRDLPRDVSFVESQSTEEQSSLSASATGLVTSAAASVASLWPWKKTSSH